jgi:murein hydrolase activator
MPRHGIRRIRSGSRQPALGRGMRDRLGGRLLLRAVGNLSLLGAARLVGTMPEKPVGRQDASPSRQCDALAEFTKALSVAHNQDFEGAEGSFPTRDPGGWRRIGVVSTLVEPRRMRARALPVAAPRGQPRDRRQPGRGRQAARSRWSVAGGPTLLAAVILGALAAGLLPLPESVAAAWSRSSDRTTERIEPQGPGGLRASLEQRRELQRALRDQLRALAAEVDALGRRRDRISEMLRSERQQALSLERRLDHLVPRLLAREAEVRARRARAARALAELAAKSRSVRIVSTARARMLAIGPLVLERLRSVESDPGPVRRPEQAMQQYAKIARSLSDLTTERRGVSGDLTHERRQRQGALERLRELDVDVRLPAEQQARLADRFLHAGTAVPGPAGPAPDRGARLDLAGVRGAAVAGVREAAVAGIREAGVVGVREAALAGVREAAVAEPSEAAERRLRTPGMLQAEHRSASQLLAAVPAAADRVGPASLAGEADWPTMALAARPRRSMLRSEGPQTWPGASHDAISRAAPLDVAFAPPRRLPAIAAAGGATPLVLPLAEPSGGRNATRRGHPEITIAAAPGQGVATPVEGTIVFAGRFKSYGLLLIIEHEREYHTLLWGFAWLDVSLGDYVQVGQVVGIMGARGDDPPVLHVERRRNGRPIHLAASSSGIQG